MEVEKQTYKYAMQIHLHTKSIYANRIDYAQTVETRSLDGLKNTQPHFKHYEKETTTADSVI